MTDPSNVIVISLARATERRTAMRRQLQGLGVVAHFLDAVDGRDLDGAALDRRITLPGWFRFGETMLPGELGCTMSHIRALEKAEADGMRDVVILEDDVTLAEDFPQRIDFLRRILPADWEHAYLAGGLKRPTSTIWLGTPHVTRSRFTTGTFAMMVRASAYAKVLSRLRGFDAPADDLYAHMIAVDRTLKSYTYYPFPVHTQGGFSYVWEDARDAHPSTRYYRARVRGHSAWMARGVSAVRWWAEAPGRLWQALS